MQYHAISLTTLPIIVYHCLERITYAIYGQYYPFREDSMQIADNFAYVVPVDYLLHTPEKPFCYDETCPCKEDQEAISQVAAWVVDGLITPAEATDLVAGRGI